MKKRKVRVYRGYGSCENRFNIEVYYTCGEHGYEYKLFSCMKCGEIFVFDMDNPNAHDKNMKDIVINMTCPTCGALLMDFIKEYPKYFVCEYGVGHFVPDNIIPPEAESLIKEFWEINLSES